MRVRYSEEELLQIIRDNPDVSYEEIANQLGYSASTRGSSLAFVARKAGIIRGKGVPGKPRRGKKYRIKNIFLGKKCPICGGRIKDIKI